MKTSIYLLSKSLIGPKTVDSSGRYKSDVTPVKFRPVSVIVRLYNVGLNRSITWVTPVITGTGAAVCAAQGTAASHRVRHRQSSASTRRATAAQTESSQTPRAPPFPGRRPPPTRAAPRVRCSAVAIMPLPSVAVDVPVPARRSAHARREAFAPCRAAARAFCRGALDALEFRPAAPPLLRRAPDVLLLGSLPHRRLRTIGGRRRVAPHADQRHDDHRAAR